LKDSDKGYELLEENARLIKAYFQKTGSGAYMAYKYYVCKAR